MDGKESDLNTLRVLCVTGYYKPAYQYGGPVRSISALCEGLARLGVQTTVFTTNANGKGRLPVDLHRDVDINGVSVWYFPLSYGGLNFFYSRSLKNAVRKKTVEFDLVIAETLWLEVGETIHRTCQSAHIPYVVPLRGQLQPWALAHKSVKKSIFMAWRAKGFLNQAAALICSSDEEARNAALLGYATPIIVVPNGIDIAHYGNLGGGKKIFDQFGIPENALVLLFMGRLDPIKKPEIAIEVCASLRKLLDVPVHLILAGPGSPERLIELSNLSYHFQVNNLVHITGLLDEKQIWEILSEVNLLLMPSSVNENFGMSALEALAAGVPVLVSEGVPVGRWAVQAGAGRIASCDAGAFTQAAAEMLSDPYALAEMGRRGRDLVQQKFDSQVVARQMLTQFQAIIATGRPLEDSDAL